MMFKDKHTVAAATAGEQVTYLGPVRESRYELRGHPVWRSHQRLPSLHLFRDLGAEAKVRQLHLETNREQVKQVNKAFLVLLQLLEQ